MPARARQHRPVGALPRVGIVHIAVCNAEAFRVILVVRFAVEHRLEGQPLIILLNHLIVEPAARVSALNHVEIQPFLVMRAVGGMLSARRMHGHQIPAAVARLQAARHGVQRFHLLSGGENAVAAHDPDDIARLPVPSAQPFAVNIRLFLREDMRAVSAHADILVAPCR